MSAQRKPPKSFFVLILCGWAILACAAPAAAGANPAVGEARLIDGGVRADGRYAGVRLDLPGEALTYWRDPGDAGVAPTFDFSGSDNLASSEVLYPAPARYDEAGAQAIGYKHEVIFPLRLKAKDPKRPIALALTVDYAVCEKLCYPAHAALRLELPPQGPASQGFDTALTQVPRALGVEDARAFAALAPVAHETTGDFWILSLKAPARDLFVEPPTGYVVEVSRAGKGFRLAVTGKPESGPAIPPEPLRVTATGDAPVEFSLSLK